MKTNTIKLTDRKIIRKLFNSKEFRLSKKLSDIQAELLEDHKKAIETLKKELYCKE